MYPQLKNDELEKIRKEVKPSKRQSRIQAQADTEGNLFNLYVEQSKFSAEYRKMKPEYFIAGTPYIDVIKNSGLFSFDELNDVRSKRVFVYESNEIELCMQRCPDSYYWSFDDDDEMDERWFKFYNRDILVAGHHVYIETPFNFIPMASIFNNKHFDTRINVSRSYLIGETQCLDDEINSIVMKNLISKVQSDQDKKIITAFIKFLENKSKSNLTS